jgi:hypothetical protein
VEYQTAPAPEVEERRYVRDKTPKYGASFWIWAALGLLLHLVALGILIVVIIRWSSADNSKKAPKGRSQSGEPHLIAGG